MLRLGRFALAVTLLVIAGAGLLGCEKMTQHMQHSARRSSARRQVDQKTMLARRVNAIQTFLGTATVDRCDLPRVNGLELTWESFNKQYRGRNLILTGLEKGQAPPMRWTRESFTEAFGDRRVKANNGYFDRSRTRAVTTVREYLSINVSDMNIFLVEHDAVVPLRNLSSIAALPLFSGFDYRPILSLGVAASPTQVHKHQETWLHLLAGRKAWWLGTAEARASLPGGDPCLALSSLETTNLSFCVQQPGQVIHFGNLTPHATCNLDSIAFAIGAQGHTESLPPTIQAARHGRTAVLEQLVESHGPVVSMDSELDYMNRTALQHGVLIGHAQIVTQLLQARADPHPASEPKPLQAAAESGSAELVNLLLEVGASPFSRDALGGQAAHYAAKGGHTAVLRLLLERRVSLDGHDRQGAQPLHWAAAEGDVATLAFLVEHNADIDAKATDEGSTPLHWAARCGHVSHVTFLLQRRADHLLSDKVGFTARDAAAVMGRHVVEELLRAVVATASDASSLPVEF